MDAPKQETTVEFLVREMLSIYGARFTDENSRAAAVETWARQLRRATLAGQPATPAARPTAWMKGHVTPGSVHGPAEYDVEFCYGDTSPGDGWIPLYREPQKGR